VNPEARGGALEGRVISAGDGPIRVGEEIEVAAAGAGTWALLASEGSPRAQPPPGVWCPPSPPANVVRRLEEIRFEVLVEMLDPGPALPAAVLFGTGLADRIASLADGVVHDPEAIRVYGPGGWRVEPPGEEPAPRDHVTLHVVPDEPPGTAWIHTHGLRKFGRPELEVYDVPDELIASAGWSFVDVVSYLIGGALLVPGHTLGDPQAPIAIRIGGRDREHWEDVPVLELVDLDEVGEPQTRGAASGLAAWARFDADA
jgi:hypothetical protein